MFISVVFVFILSIVSFFVYINHTRISKMNTGQKEFMALAKQKLVYMEQIFQEKINNNQRITAEIIEILMNKMRNIERSFTEEEMSVDSEIVEIDEKLKRLHTLNNIYSDIGLIEPPTQGTGVDGSIQPISEENEDGVVDTFTNDIPERFLPTSKHASHKQVMSTYLQ